MRKEVRSVAVGATPHVVDCVGGEPRIEQLKANQSREVTVRFRVAAVDHTPSPGRALHLPSNLLADFERTNSNVRTDRSDQNRRIIGKRLNRVWHDAGDGAPPTRVDRGDGAALQVGDENRYTVGGASRDGNPLASSDESVAFRIRDRGRLVASRDLPNDRAMNLALLEQTLRLDSQASRET